MNDIPVKVIKENKDIVAFFTHRNFSNSLSSSSFPTTLKYADVKTVKKLTKVIRKRDTLSKLYKRVIYNQIDAYFDKLFSKFQCGLREGLMLSTARSLWSGDLYKAFDFTDHE